MKPINTALRQPQTPPVPRKGDIKACKHYAKHQARNSNHPRATLAHIWIKFIQHSYLQDQEVKL